MVHTHTHKYKHPLVQSFPKAQEHGPVQVAPVAAELQDGHVPFLNVGVCLSFVVLQMKGPNWSGTQRQMTSEPLKQLQETYTLHNVNSQSIQPMSRGVAMVTSFTHFWRICQRGSRRAAATASP